MGRSLGLAAFALALFQTVAQSQIVVADLRSGVAADGSFIDPGMDDDDYVLTSGPPGTGTYPRPATVVVPWPGWGRVEDAQWMSFDTTLEGPSGSYVYETSFSIPVGSVGPALVGQALADDDLTIRLNDVVIPRVGWDFQVIDPELFVQGENRLVFEVVNRPNLTGLQVSAEVSIEGAGPRVHFVEPPQSLFHEESWVIVHGEGFLQSGLISVMFGDVLATSVVWLSSTELLCLAPPGNEDETVDVTVSQGGVSGTLLNAFSYVSTTITGIDVVRGNVAGGTPVRLSLEYGAGLADTEVSVGGTLAAVTQAGEDFVEFLTPGESAVPIALLDIEVSGINGSDLLPAAFTYTPLLTVGVTGNTDAGSIDIAWLTDPSADPMQPVSLWLGNPARSPLALHLSGYAGQLEEVPFLYLLANFPANFDQFSIPFGPVDPVVAGVPLRLQALFQGEGDVLGSFSNVGEFAIPGA